MGLRQHRCPFYQLKIEKKDLELIKSKKNDRENSIDYYKTQINSLSQKFLSFQSCIKQIIDIINPFIKHEEPLTLEECVNKSFLNSKTKSSTLSLLKKYKNFCNQKIESSIISSCGDLKPEDIKTIYDPKNAYEFVVTDKNYQRSSVKKNLNTLIRYIRLATNNPFLRYNLPLGIGEPAKLKHIITEDELKKFVWFLNSKKLYILIVMTMLLYKFGLRIGALAKLKVNDLLDNGIIIFREKNSKIIKRQLLKETFDILTLLINEC